MAKTKWLHFAEDPLKCIFFNITVRILINISLRFVPKVPINNIPGDKP